MATRRQLPGFGFGAESTENFDFSQPLDMPQAAPAVPSWNPQVQPPAQPNGVITSMEGGAPSIHDPGVADGMQDEFAAYRKLDSNANASDADLYSNDDFQNWLATGQGPAKGQAQSQGQTASQSDIMSELRGFFQGGQPNQEIINRRTEGARENLERFSKSRNATNRAALANRGLIGDGPELTAQNRVEEDLADRYSGAVSQIYADELGRGDDRMMEALRLAAGIEQGGLDRQLSETLGLGNLALGNYRAQSDYDLGLGNLGLGQDQLAADIQSGGIDQLLTILQLLTQGAGQSAEGYTK